MKITVQKTMNVPDPVRAHDTDAGLDLSVPEGQSCLVRPGAVYTIDLGLRLAIPDGYYGQLTLRSSAGKKGLTIPNGVGVIDSGYRGNIKLLVTAAAEPVLVAAEERICQLIILPLPHVDVEAGTVEDDTSRGAGGFGSTGAATVVRDYTAQKAGTLTVGRPDREPETAAITGRLLPCERGIVECLVRSASKSGEAAEEDFRDAARHVRRIACDEEGLYDPATAEVAIGHIVGVIAAFTPNGPGLWQDVHDAAIRLSDEWSEERPAKRREDGQRTTSSTSTNNKEETMGDRINLTVGGLIRELQEISFRYGNDTPVVIPTFADADYEQATAPIVMHARREAVPADWDLFHIDPSGEAAAVIS